jgi:predicted alpha/beta hydrolase family esterase
MNSNLEVLILPGINGSGPQHWQTYWEKANPEYRRVVERDWTHPVCDEWMQPLENAVKTFGPGTVLVAHSLACLQVAHWAQQTTLRIRGAFLVAPPDPENPNFPDTVSGFSPAPLRKLPFPSMLVASSNDPYGDLGFSLRLAEAWGSKFVNIGPAGHINADSGLGDWLEGYQLFRSFLKQKS